MTKAIANNIGNACSDNGRKDKALDSFKEAIALSEKHDEVNTTSDPLNNIGNIYFYREAFDQALQYYTASLGLEENNKNLLGQALALSIIGSSYLELGELSKAEHHQFEAKNIAMNINANPILQLIYQGLARPITEEVILKRLMHLGSFMMKQEKRFKMKKLAAD